MNNKKGNPNDKAKNFNEAIKRLFKELKGFKIFIIVSLILAMFGAILSISAPNKLSKLTDEISKGLAVDSENLELLTTKITDNLSEEKLSKKNVPKRKNLVIRYICLIVCSFLIKKLNNENFSF